MAFCTQCGKQLAEGSRFCANCGTPVGIPEAKYTFQRETVYEGNLHKCPNCGEVLHSFTAICPACGHELRGAKVSRSVHEFAQKLEHATSDDQRLTLIRNFPIPNTKEDIFEFMILASTNLADETQKFAFRAWHVKFEQSYQKAKLVFFNDADFVKFQNIYDQTNKQINRRSNLAAVKKAGSIIANSSHVLPQIVIALGWLISIYVLIPLCGVNLDNVGTNSYQLLLIFDLIVGAVVIPWIIRCEAVGPKLITILGLVLSIVVLIPLCGKNLDVAGANAYQLILIVDIISSVIIFVRTLKKPKN